MRRPDFSNARVGDKVYGTCDGNGEIDSIGSDSILPIKVRFHHLGWESFDVDGILNMHSRIFYGHDIFDHLPDSCFEPPERLPELEVDAKVWVKIGDQWEPRHFAKWEGKKMIIFCDGWTSHSANSMSAVPTISCGSWSLTDPKESE